MHRLKMREALCPTPIYEYLYSFLGYLTSLPVFRLLIGVWWDDDELGSIWKEAVLA
jgi:hypothetical protein